MTPPVSTLKSRPEFIEHLDEVFRAFGAIHARRMFGGYGIYREGIMIGLVIDETLYLKTDADTIDRFRSAGSEPFRYDKRGETVVTSYHSMPVDAFDDPERARDWATIALEAALRSAQHAPKRRRTPARPAQAAEPG